MSILKIDGVDGDVHRPKKFATLFATAAIAKGDVVMIDTGTTTNGVGMHVKKTDADDSVMTIGVAATAATAAGDTVRIQVAGYNEDVTSSSATISLDAAVGCDTAGKVELVGDVDANQKAFAVCVNDFSADSSDGAILILDHGLYG